MSVKETLPPAKYHTSLSPVAWVKHMFSMTKPGIIGGNIITALAGFSFGIENTIHLITLLATMTGIACVIASAGVFNNYIDRDIDSLMHRTQRRASLQTPLSTTAIIIYALTLFATGCFLLYLCTNTMALVVAVAGFAIYLGPYTLWLKRHSHWSTLTGSIAGATPPVIAYCAAYGKLDSSAFYLFLIVASWQMPHFIAISLYRVDDFKAASIPTLPAIKGVSYTQRSILFWIALFILFLFLPFYAGKIHFTTFTVMLGSSIIWLCYGLWKKINRQPEKQWGRQMFLASLIIIFIISTLFCLDSIM